MLRTKLLVLPAILVICISAPPLPETEMLQESVTMVTPVSSKDLFTPLPIELDEALQRYTYQRCQELDVPFALALAMMWNESRFTPDIVSADGKDYGLFQLRKAYHQGDLLDPYHNIDTALKLLSTYLEQQDGDVTRALMMYNCGPTGAKRLWSRGKTETVYVRKILNKADEYRPLLEHPPMAQLLLV